MVNNFFSFSLMGVMGMMGVMGPMCGALFLYQNLYTALTPMLRPGLYALVICSTSRLVPFE